MCNMLLNGFVVYNNYLTCALEDDKGNRSVKIWEKSTTN